MLLAAGACAGITACADWPSKENAAELAASCETSSTPGDNTKLVAIEQMVNDGKLYAAIAELDALGNRSVKARLVRADALRRIDKDAEASEVYQSLIGSCVDGRAQHGLGLIAARKGDLRASLDHLKLARQAMPTDSRIRNDLGFAYLQARQLEDARFEFMTALDLNPKELRAGKNLVLLNLIKGDDNAANLIAQRLGLDEGTRSRLATEAKTWSDSTAQKLLNTDPIKVQP